MSGDKRAARADRQAANDELYAAALSRTEAAAEHVFARLLVARGDVGAAALANAGARLDAEIMDRTRGKAVQANLNVTPDDLSRLSDDELRSELARVERSLAAVEAGAAAEAPAQPVSGVRD